MFSGIKFIGLTGIAVATYFGSINTVAQVEKFTLDNGVVVAEVTPDIGGRLMSFALKDQPNFLLLADLHTKNLHPVVSAESPNIGYLGHEMWVGPQSQWWVHQNASLKRAANKAEWPPDPYLILAKNRVIEQSAKKVVLESPESPITGIQMVKTYALLPERKNSLKLHVRATNIRKENIAWDIWFNTRVPANTLVYVPVAREADVEQKNMEDEVNAALIYTLSDGILSLDMAPPPAGKMSRKGKLMIQPSQGWMAGFRDKQVFIVQFPHQPKSAIHPEQGQIELYNEYNPGNLAEGLLEMEVHAPYKQLAPKEFMVADETWTILEYKGPATRNAHVAFLRKLARELDLK